MKHEETEKLEEKTLKSGRNKIILKKNRKKQKETKRNSKKQ